MRRKNKIFLFMAVVLFFSVSCPDIAEAADGKELLKKNQYTTKDRNEKKHDFEKEISEDGTRYRLQKVTYQVKAEKPVTTVKPIAVFLPKKTVKRGESYTPPETIEKDGVVCKLQENRKREVVLKKGYTRTITGYLEFESEKAARTAPETRKMTARDDKSGQAFTLACRNKGMKKIEASSWRNTHINITFISYDADTFRWGGISVKKNEKHPLQGYEKRLIKSVGGNPKNYRVNNISWQGKAYRNAEGVLCRNAVAAVSKRVPHYRVYYLGSQKVPAEKGTAYTPIYAGLKEIETGEIEYAMVATAHYTKVKDVPVLAITAGILLAVLLIVGILWIVRKKRKDTQSKDIRYVDLMKEGTYGIAKNIRAERKE